MKHFKPAYRMFCKAIFLNLALIAQLVIGFIFISTVIGYYLNENITDNLLSPLLEKKYVYFQADFYNRDFDFNEIASELHGIQSVNKQYKMEMTDANGNIGSLTAIDKDVDALVRYPLLRGNYYNECENEDGVINVITLNNGKYKIGDKLSCRSISSQKKITLKITGIMAEPTFILDMSTSGDELATIDLFDWYDASSSDNVFICDISFLQQDVIESHNMILIFDNSISDEEFDRNITVLKNYGWTAQKNELYENSKVLTSFYFSKIAPYGFLILAIAIMGIIGMSILITYKNQRDYAIYFICGYSLKDCMAINIIYNLMIVVFSILIFCVYSAISKSLFENSLSVFNTYSIFFFGIFSIMAIFLGSLIPCLILKKMSPKEMLRG